MKVPKSLFLLAILTATLYLGLFFVLARVTFQGTPLIHNTVNYYKQVSNNAWHTFHDYDPSAKQDVTVIGSSHAERGYDPEIFAAGGYDMFNLGTQTQTPLNTYILIKHLLDSTNCPLLLYDVYDAAFMQDGFECTVDLAQGLPNWSSALDMTKTQGDLRGINLLGLRLATKGSKPNYYGKNKYRGRGYSMREDSIKVPAAPPGGKARAIPQEQKAYFEACIDLCQERGIKMIATNHYARSNKLGAQYDNVQAYLHQTLEARGIPYIDLSKTAGIEEGNWFADENHLNGTGARLFTKQLMDTLEALGYLRNDPGTNRP